MPPRRRHQTSPPANLLDDENLLAEFLLRLPPRPSSLPRAAAVCKAWRRIVTDPRFLHRFRAHHRKAPLLGFFPTLEAPDRVPDARLSLSMVLGWRVVGCRDGLVLCGQRSRSKLLQVLDPMTGDKSAILTREDKLPHPLDVKLVVHSTGVKRLCFRLYALSTNADWTKLSVSIYSSDSGAWAHSVETMVSQPTFLLQGYPPTFVGNGFYWPHERGEIVRYDLETQALTIIEAPLNNEEADEYGERVLIMTKDGLVIITISEETIQLWVRETILYGAAKWVLRKTIQPNTLFPLPLEQDESRWLYKMAGFEEENNVLFLKTRIGLSMFNLESMKFTRVSEKKISWLRHCRIQ